MKTNIITSLFIMIFVTSVNCQVKKVKIIENEFHPQKNESILIAINVINNINQPTLPLIDAMQLDIHLNTISKDICELFKTQGDMYDEELSNILGLRSFDKLKSMDIKNDLPDSLIFDEFKILSGEKYPELILSNKSKMIFPVKNGHFSKYFSNQKEISSLTAHLCNHHNCEYILISNSYLKFTKPRSNSCKSSLICELFIIDKNGVLVFEGIAESIPNFIGIYSGKDRRQRTIDNFEKELNKYPILINELLANINW